MLPLMNEKTKPSDDQNTRVKRLGRYARVGTSMGGLAAKLAGEKFLGLTIDRDDHAKALRGALGNLRGPLLKVAQLLATIPEALPKEYVAELQHLQSNAPPMGWPFVKRRMKTELGDDWQSKFKSFDRGAVAAASLGQVHKAISLKGEALACKLQYPDMASAVEADLQQLRIVLSLFEKYDKAISTKYIIEEIEARLREELDYTLEAKYTRAYGEMLALEDSVTVARVFDELSTDRLITTSWVEGHPVLNFKEAPLEQRNTIAMALFRAWYIPLYHYGIIHGDPHLGNYTIRDDCGINLLDFGCVRVFPPVFIKAVLDLYKALQTDDRNLAVHAFETWGFENLSDEVIDILLIWAGFLYDPILDNKKRVIGQTNGQVYGRSTAEEVHKKLRAAGGVTVPREFVFMDRAALGLGSVFIHLQAEVNWYEVFQNLTQDFDLKTVTDNQKRILATHHLIP